MNSEQVSDVIKGRVQMRIRNKETGKEVSPQEYARLCNCSLSDFGMNEEGVIDNLICEGLHYVLAYLFVNSKLDQNEIYLAVGSGSTAAARVDKKLVSETQRVKTKRAYDLSYSLAVPDPDNSSDRSNVVRINGNIKDGDFNINELGLFWGDAATTNSGTGKLMSRVVTSRPIPKLPNMELEFIWIYIFRFIN